eukprot:889756-Ditylum_brightwellii.AAC.1
MAKYKHQFKTKALLDKMFTAKKLYAVDARMQRWSVECRKAQGEIDGRIIEFRDIVSNMVSNRFYLSLPPSFTMINGDEGNEETSFKQGK